MTCFYGHGGNDWDREWNTAGGRFTGWAMVLLLSNPALSQCDNAAERLTRWLTLSVTTRSLNKRTPRLPDSPNG